MMLPRDYRNHVNSIAGDLADLFQQDPDVFDVILFKAQPAVLETVTSVTDVVGSLESDSRRLTYADPALTKAILIPFDFKFFATEDGFLPNDGTDQPVILLLAEQDVPRQSRIVWQEYSDDETMRLVSFYVQSSEAYGQAPVLTMAHYCLPCIDDDVDWSTLSAFFVEPVEPEEPEDPEEP